MLKQESKRLNQADLEGGSKTIGFVEYGIPYYEGVFDICISGSILRHLFTSSASRVMTIALGLRSNMLRGTAIKPVAVFAKPLSQFARLSCTIRNTCGGKVQRFQKGETIVLNTVIRDSDGDLFTPSSGVTAEIRNEAGTKIMNETAMELVSDGEYSLDVQTTASGFVSGQFIVIFKATDGTRIAIDWDRFRVEVVPGL